MRSIAGYMILGGLTFLLSSCASPYYAAPAPVYYPLQGSGIYYPAQRASIYYPPHVEVYPDQARGSESRPARPPAREQSQAGREIDRRPDTSDDSDWIDPEPYH
jgi:hypothetical protein